MILPRLLVQQFRHKGIEPQIAHDFFIVHVVGLAHDLHGTLANVALGHIFQPPALVLDVLHFQIQQGGQLAGERLIPLLVAVLHGLDSLVVAHIPDDKGHFR